MRSFLAMHRSRSPFFRQIPDEFIHFLQSEEAIPANYPEFVLELAHYEWVELALSISTLASARDALDREGSLLEQRPVLPPEFANPRYNCPVHRIGARTPVMQKETYLLVFRNADDQIQFTEINAFTSRLINLLASAEHTGKAALQIVAVESRHPSPEVVIQGGLEIMRDLMARGAILGVFK